MSRELRADDLREALELAENFYDGTDYNFDRLTPDEQAVIVDAARSVLTGVEVSGRDVWFRHSALDGQNTQPWRGRYLVIPLAGVPEKESSG